jgi:hypothetical protein
MLDLDVQPTDFYLLAPFSFSITPAPNLHPDREKDVSSQCKAPSASYRENRSTAHEDAFANNSMKRLIAKTAFSDCE